MWHLLCMIPRDEARGGVGLGSVSGPLSQRSHPAASVAWSSRIDTLMSWSVFSVLVGTARDSIGGCGYTCPACMCLPVGINKYPW